MSPFYHALQPTTLFLCKGVWRNKAPLLVTFFRYTAALGRILMMDNLRMRVLVMCWCCMCKMSEETVNLLLLHCEVEVEFGPWCLIFLTFLG